MPRNGSGVFSRTNGTFSGSSVWSNDRDAGTKITASNHDTHDQDIADAITASLAKDGQTTPTADLPMGGFKHTNVDDAAARNQYASAGQIQDEGLTYFADTGAADAYVITPSPAITAYAAGQRFAFKAANQNTGSSTLNVNALGAKSIKRLSDQNLTSGSIEAGQIVVVQYDGTNFQMLSQLANTGTAAFKNTGTSGGAVPLLNAANSFSNQTKFTSGSGAQVELELSSDTALAGPTLDLDRNSASPADSDLLGQIRWLGRNDAAEEITYAIARSDIATVTDGAENGQFKIQTYRSGSFGTRVTIGGGVQIGSPTGGDKGNGHLNTSGNVYVNNSILAELSDVALTEAFVSAEQDVTLPSTLTLAHGLSAVPRNVAVWLHCETAQYGYTAGDEVLIPGVQDANRGVAAVIDTGDTTNVKVLVLNGIYVPRKDSAGSTGDITAANWKIIVRAWA